jgi:menaquinone-dependent protoporphyrinogen IX oxidase
MVVRSLVIYESEYGNTEKVAHAIAEALGEHGEAPVAQVGSVATLDAEGLDLLVVGAPTQRHALPARVKELLERTPEGVLAGVRALAFNTRYHRSR